MHRKKWRHDDQKCESHTLFAHSQNWSLQCSDFEYFSPKRKDILKNCMRWTNTRREKKTKQNKRKRHEKENNNCVRKCNSTVAEVALCVCASVCDYIFIDYCDRNMTMINTSAHFFIRYDSRTKPRTFSTFNVCMLRLHFIIRMRYFIERETKNFYKEKLQCLRLLRLMLLLLVLFVFHNTHSFTFPLIYQSD